MNVSLLKTFCPSFERKFGKNKKGVNINGTKNSTKNSKEINIKKDFKKKKITFS